MRTGLFVIGVIALLSSIAFGQPRDTISLTLGIANEPYKLDTDEPFRTVRIGNPKILDAKALSDRTILFQALAPGATNVLFLDEKNNVIKNLGVFISAGGLGQVQILTPGPRHSISSLYRCNAHGCEFLQEDQLQFPERVYRNINQDAPSENPSSPNSGSPQARP